LKLRTEDSWVVKRGGPQQPRETEVGEIWVTELGVVDAATPGGRQPERKYMLEERVR
jgi:hypothetical protein